MTAQIKHALVYLLAVIAITSCSSEPTRAELMFDSYVRKCADKGGIVVGASVGTWAVEYKCIGDGPEELLPRMVY